MKKTLITLALFAASSVAALATEAEDYPGLVYAMELDDGLTSTSTLNPNGTTSIDLSSYNLNTTDGFTISINTQLSSSTYSAWSHILMLGFDNWTNPTTNTNFTNGPAISWQSVSSGVTGGVGINPAIFEGSSTLVANETGKILVDTAYNVILTVLGDTWTISVYDSAGDCIATNTLEYDYSDTNPLTTLSSIAIGGTTAGSTDNSSFNKATDEVDNLAVFDYVLTDTEQVNLSISTLNGYGVIPEPSTATLSLLALAGLCVRRRRK